MYKIFASSSSSSLPAVKSSSSARWVAPEPPAPRHLLPLPLATPSSRSCSRCARCSSCSCSGFSCHKKLLKVRFVRRTPKFRAICLICRSVVDFHWIRRFPLAFAQFPTPSLKPAKPRSSILAHSLCCLPAPPPHGGQHHASSARHPPPAATPLQSPGTPTPAVPLVNPVRRRTTTTRDDDVRDSETFWLQPRPHSNTLFMSPMSAAQRPSGAPSSAAAYTRRAGACSAASREAQLPLPSRCSLRGRRHVSLLRGMMSQWLALFACERAALMLL